MAGAEATTNSGKHLPRNNLHQIIKAYLEDLKNNGRADGTLETHKQKLHRLTKLCDIHNPDAVKKVIANAPWENSTKQAFVQIYDSFRTYQGKTWKRPAKYKRQSKIPYIPTELELDALISASRPKLAAVLQFLKETGARIGEAMRTTWLDINTEKKTVYIHAEKDSNDRILPISETLLSMLGKLPKTSDNVFQTNSKSMRVSLESLRKNTALKLGNPRLNQIYLHTFRHWKATTEQHKTHDAWHVKQILGHKTIRSTETYIHIDLMLSNCTNDEYICKVAHNEQEAIQLIEAGFEYVSTMGASQLYRKRK